MIWKALIMILISFAFVCVSEAFIHSVNNSEASDGYYKIDGEITSKDVIQLKEILQRLQTIKFKWRPWFILNSSGGDIYAAMEIGRLLRKAHALGDVSGAKCFSSCVLVLAGAVERLTEGGKIGIHRPYSTYIGNRDYESTQIEFRKTGAAVRAYLLEMNLPEQLYDAMVSVPPEKIRILTEEEIEAFGLSGIDPVEQETKDSKEAFQYGISKTKYFQRKAIAENNCPIPKDPLTGESAQAQIDCVEAIMYGVPLQLYKTRILMFENLCSGYNRNPKDPGACFREVIQGKR